MKTLLTLISLLLFINGYTQIPKKHAKKYPMKTLEQLINTEDPAWDLVMQWKKEARNKVEILPKDSLKADSALYRTQVSTYSPMGAIVYESGGILIDDGWIRILGSGSEKLPRDLMGWNKGKSFQEYGNAPSFILIADDVLGGFYAINGGGLDAKHLGNVYYFAPESLEWENLDIGYSQFIGFCFSGDIKSFYEDFYWTDWEKEVPKMNGDQAIYCYPFLSSKEGQDINKVQRGIVPIQEMWDFFVGIKIKK